MFIHIQLYKYYSECSIYRISGHVCSEMCSLGDDITAKLAPNLISAAAATTKISKGNISDENRAIRCQWSLGNLFPQFYREQQLSLPSKKFFLSYILRLSQ